MNNYSELNRFTPAALKNVREFFTKRGALDKPFVQDPVQHEEFKGMRGEFISNGGKHMTLKRIGFYDDQFVVITCPTCYAKFFDNIQLLKELDCYAGMDLLSYNIDHPKKNKVAGDAEHFVLRFNGHASQIMKKIDKVLSFEIEELAKKSKK